MKKYRSDILLGVLLILLSAATYLFHYVLFHDPHHIFIYLVGDVGFVFLEVLLVSLIIHKVLNEREKRLQLQKLNMVIGAFFSEVGTGLLATLSDADDGLAAFRDTMLDRSGWDKKKIARTRHRLSAHSYHASIADFDLSTLKAFLTSRRDFLLRLLENPALLEHETFTELLRSVFHLTEELDHRTVFDTLPQIDRQHLEGDINRVYNLLVLEWYDYLVHLHNHYPYLFSLALRLNPFDRNANAVLTE